MGVRGLTTYIADNADRFLDPLELHDCNLVIDGDSLSSQLYKSTSACNSAFGGNYDQYFSIICNFFEMLKQCEITSYVLLDGGYQMKKLNTVKQRLRSKVGAIRHLNPLDCKSMFPLMMREVFVEAMQKCNIHYMRCLFEADDEVAALSRKLKCPLLSFDSDFYIHNVAYIPSVTLKLKVFRRNIPDKQSVKKVRQRKDLISEIDSDGNCLKFKVQKVADDLKENEKKCYYYMQCSVYRIKNLARDRHLRPEMLPLFAILLGNDYISSSIFRKFYLNVSMKSTGKNNTYQGKRIIALLRWLQNETLSSAINKIIGHIEKERKEWIREQINIGIAGYKHENSIAFQYFGFSDQSSSIDATQNTISTVEKNDETLKNDIDAPYDENGDLDIEELDDTKSQNEDRSTQSCTDYYSSDGEIKTTEVEKTNSKNSEIICFTPPEWLHSKILGGKLPRFIVDLMTLNLYINAPQVENFMLPDSNKIGVPILRLIFSILHQPYKREFRYLTRVQRRTDIEYKRIQSLDIGTKFDSNVNVNFETFKLALIDFDDMENVFASIEKNAPLNLRLFFISIIYWSRHSDHFNVVYVSSLLLCQIVLTVIDSMLEPIRNQSKFEKLYQSSNIRKVNSLVEHDSLMLSIEDYLKIVTKDECISAQSHLIDLFQLSDKMKTKHTEFSSDILHGFAEFQAVVYQLNALNVICGEPFQSVEMSKCFNGCFLYNTYNALKDRPNIKYYIEKFLLSEASVLYKLYEAMMRELESFITCLSKETISKRKKKRNANKKLARERRKNSSVETEVLDTKEVSANHSDSDFEDLNNKFSCLLRM